MFIVRKIASVRIEW